MNKFNKMIDTGRYIIGMKSKDPVLAKSWLETNQFLIDLLDEIAPLQGSSAAKGLVEAASVIVANTSKAADVLEEGYRRATQTVAIQFVVIAILWVGVIRLLTLLP